jgi:hypothetical protein
MSNIIQIGSAELTNAEIESAVAAGKEFLATCRTIYQMQFPKNAGWHGLKLYTERGALPIMQRGRFMFLTGTAASKLSSGAIAA